MKPVIFIFLILFLCTCSSTKEQERFCMMFEGNELNKDSLKTHIDEACRIWESRIWSREYDQDIFLNYILPPRIADEPVEYYWRTDLPKRLDLKYKGEPLLDFAEKINGMIDIDMGRQNWGNNQMGYSVSISGKSGKCDDRAILTTMAMRSMGIPAAFETIPLWGGTNNGHSFCGIVMSDNTTYAFQEKGDKFTNIRFVNKVPKIYRLRYFVNTQSKLYLLKDSESIPNLFEKFRLEDVTRYHGVGCRDIDIQADVESSNRLCYLSVFHPRGWFPIACGDLTDGLMRFKDVGTGVDINMTNPLKGKNIGDGILYLPIVYEDKIIPISYPLIVSHSSTRLLKPSLETESIMLYRKYPLFERILVFADRMKGCVIETANKPDFSDSKVIYYIHDRPVSYMQTIELQETFRYIRFRRPAGALSIAELQMYDSEERVIEGKPMVCKHLDNVPEIVNIFDKNPLTFMDIPHGIDLWVGLDMGRTIHGGYVGFCPRNDDNGITSGDMYELFFWDNEWISLGEKHATGHALRYDNVPKNALLWLRNKTKGHEERPFTYENGMQIWW